MCTGVCSYVCVHVCAGCTHACVSVYTCVCVPVGACVCTVCVCVCVCAHKLQHTDEPCELGEEDRLRLTEKKRKTPAEIIIIKCQGCTRELHCLPQKGQSAAFSFALSYSDSQVNGAVWPAGAGARLLMRSKFGGSQS